MGPARLRGSACAADMDAPGTPPPPACLLYGRTRHPMQLCNAMKLTSNSIDSLVIPHCLNLAPTRVLACPMRSHSSQWVDRRQALENGLAAAPSPPPSSWGPLAWSSHNQNPTLATVNFPHFRGAGAGPLQTLSACPSARRRSGQAANNVCARSGLRRMCAMRRTHPAFSPLIPVLWPRVCICHRDTAARGGRARWFVHRRPARRGCLSRPRHGLQLATVTDRPGGAPVRAARPHGSDWGEHVQPATMNRISSFVQLAQAAKGEADLPAGADPYEDFDFSPYLSAEQTEEDLRKTWRVFTKVKVCWLLLAGACLTW